MNRFLASWAATSIAVLVTGLIVPGIHYDGLFPLLGASLLLGILNAFVRPILVLLTLPITVFTLGFFLLVVNAGLLSFTGSVVRGFEARSFGAAMLGSIFISLLGA